MNSDENKEIKHSDDGTEFRIETVDHPYYAWRRQDFTEIQTAWRNLKAAP
jgi:hypothetical protein